MNVFELFAKISLDTSEYDAGLDGASKKANSFGDKLKSGFSAIEKVGKGTLSVVTEGFKAVESVGKSAGNAMKTGLKFFGTATTAMVGFGTAAVKNGMDFDATMSTVQALTGATGEDFTALRNKAIEMGESTVFSAKEAADAMTYMGMAGWKTEDMLGGIEGIMNLAAASGEDLATTSDIVTDALTAFGLTAKDSSRFADVLAVAATNANTDVAMMGDTFRYVAPLAGAMEYSVEDTALAIGLMANSGVKATQAGTSLRTIITRLSTDAGASKYKLGALGTLTQELGVAFYNTDGSARELNDVLMDARVAWKGLTEEQKVSYANVIAGQEAMSGWLAIMDSSDADVEKLTSAIEDCNGAAAEMAAIKVDNLAGDIKMLQSAYGTLQQVITDALTPSLREFTKFGTESIKELTRGFQEGGIGGMMEVLEKVVADAVKMLAEKAPEFARASMQFIVALGEGLINSAPEILKSANEIINVLVNGVSDFLDRHSNDLIKIGSSVIKTLASGFQAAADVIAENIGDFIPLIVEGFLAYHETLITVGLELLAAIGEGFVENKEAIANMAVNAIRNIVTSLIENAPAIFEGAAALLEALLIGFAENAELIGKGAADICTMLINAITDHLPEILDLSAQIIAGLVVGLIKGLPDLLLAVGNLCKALIDWFCDLLGIHSPSTLFAEFGSNIIEGLLQGLQTTWQSIVQFFGDAVAWFREVFSGVADFFHDVFEKAAELVKSTWQGVTEFFAGVAQGIQSVFQHVGEFLSNVFSTAWETVQNVWEFAKEFFQDVWEGIKQGVETIAEVVGEAFRNAWDAIVNVWEGTTEFFSGIWESIKNIFGNALDVFSGIGKNIIEGLWNGISGAFEWVKEKIKGVVDSIVGLFTGKDGLDIHSPSRVFQAIGQNVMLGLEGGVEGQNQAVGATMSNVVTTMIDTFTGLDALFETFGVDIITYFLQGVNSTWPQVVDFFTSAIDEIEGKWQEVKEFFADLWSSITEGAVSTWNAAKEGSQTAWEITQKAWESAGELFEKIWTTMQESAEKAWQKLQEGSKTTSEKVKSAWDGTKDFFRDIWNSIKQQSNDAWKSIKEGAASALKSIKSAWEEANSFVSDKASGTVNKITKLSSSTKSTSGINTSATGSTVGAGLAQGGSTVVNIYSPKAVDAVEAERVWNKAAQRLTMPY